MSLTARMVFALASGLVAGAIAAVFRGKGGGVFLALAEPIGTAWVNALQMVLIPLVVSLLVSVVGSMPDARSTGRLGLRAFLVFTGLLGATGVVSVILGPALVAMLPIDPATTAALRRDDAAAVAARAAGMPTVAETLAAIVPSNPIRAAADGAMLPLVVFALAFGAATTRIAPEHRAAVIGFFRGVADALLVIVGWVIRLAPIGVFALAAGLAARIGLAAVGVFAGYVIILSGVVILVTIALYGVAATLGRVPVASFARAVAPGQAIAFSARSSLAALPALVEGARSRLAFPPAVTSFVLPLAVSTLRLSTPIMWAITLPFLARLYGVDLGYGQLVPIVFTGILLSFSIPGLPSASLFLMAPFLAGLGIPTEALGIILAVDAVPDLFKGVLNVTAHLASATIVARSLRAEESPLS